MTYGNLIEGLKLFASKQGENMHVGGADHDVIYGAPDDVELTDEERAQLESWGWRVLRDYDCWGCYV